MLKRTSAGLRWLDKAFAQAEAGQAKAVVIMIQADMWDLDGEDPIHIANYRQFIDAIALKTSPFGKPVLLNGDSHGYRSDNPLMKGTPCFMEDGASEVACSDDAYEHQPYGYKLRNFHRVTVHGSVAPMEWLKLNIGANGEKLHAGPHRFGPFTWSREIQALPAAP